jgi:NADPH:quinone reductase-like Zn-dependent oxidoreductase
MKAIQFQFNSPNHTVVDIPKPAVAEDEVLVKVFYSALDTAHKAVVNREIMGHFVHSTSKKAPLYLGYHFSGVVEVTGSAVDEFSQGSEVFGLLQYEPGQTQGSFAEYITVKKDALAIKPANVAHSLAAASSTEAITALQGMRDHGGLKKGSSVLIIGAAGGVGNAAIQIAKALGATVTAVCSARDVADVRALGADTVINRNDEPDYVKTMALEGDRFDVIFDTPNILPAAATQLLKPDGTIVHTIPTLTFVWNKIKTLFCKKRIAFVECHSKRADLELLGKWLEDGLVKIPIDSTFNISDIGAAIEKQNGKKKGRVVIRKLHFFINYGPIDNWDNTTRTVVRT